MLRHMFVDAARVWAAEQFGPEAQVRRADMEEEDKTNSFHDFFSRRYVYDDIGTWAYVSGDFYFRNPDDAFAFKMRWV